LLVAFALVAAACGDDDDAEDTTTTAAEAGEETTTTAAGEETTTTAAGGDETTTTAADADMVDMAGADFTLVGAPVAAEGDASQGFIDLYNSENGSEITLETSDQFETQIRIRVEGGDPPKVAFTPQPAMACEFADLGELVSFEDMGFDIAELEATRGKFMMDIGVCDDGKHYGIPWYPNFKSIVFYHVPTFEAQGYEIPATYAEMVALSEQMVADGFTPWCFGYGSDAATGWPGTDWIEDIMIRMVGTEQYKAWTLGELRFNTPEVKAAFEKFEEILFGEGFVLGGAENVAGIVFRDSPLPLFNDPPSCLMLKQGTFISAYFPTDAAEGTLATFPFPTIDGGTGALGAGDYLMVFEDDPQIVQFVNDVISPEWMCAHGSATGGTASPIGGHGVEGVNFLPGHSDTSPDCYTTAEQIAIATVITEALAADTFVFDGGDAMPAEVGSGTFWTGMIDHSRGKDLDTVLAEIDEGWPGG